MELAFDQGRADRRRQDHDRVYPQKRCGRRIMRQEEIGGSPVKFIVNLDRDETGMIVAERPAAPAQGDKPL